jgi:hypothetical protein
MNTHRFTGHGRRLICLLLLLIALSITSAAATTLNPGDTATIPTIAQGDPVSIHGIATGQPQVGLQIWFIGYNFAKVTTVNVNSDDSYKYDLQGTDTANLAAGQYFVLIQHPMENGRFDIVYDPTSGAVINVQTGKPIYQLTGSGRLQSPASVSALMNAIGSQNIDDTFATVTFFIGQPTTNINPIGDLQQGENVTINGTTNLAVGDNLMVNIVSSSYTPANKNQASGYAGAGGMVTVMPGNGGLNTWSFTFDTSTLTPDEYLVTVSGVVQQVTATASFTVQCNSSGETCAIPGLVSVATTPTTMVPTNNSTSMPVTVAIVSTSIPTTTQHAPIPVSVCLASIAAVFLYRKLS